MCVSVFTGLARIEKPMCAQSLCVDVSSGLGTEPPSSYPSGEQSAAKPNLGFTALDKPSNGTGQEARARERETHIVRESSSEDKNITLVWHNRVVSLCVCVCCCLRIQKWDLGHSRLLLCWCICTMKLLFFLSTLFLLALSYIIHKALPSHVNFFPLSPSSVNIHSQYVTAGCAPNAPSVLISTKCESVILL